MTSVKRSQPLSLKSLRSNFLRSGDPIEDRERSSLYTLHRPYVVFNLLLETYQLDSKLDVDRVNKEIEIIKKYYTPYLFEQCFPPGHSASLQVTPARIERGYQHNAAAGVHAIKVYNDKRPYNSLPPNTDSTFLEAPKLLVNTKTEQAYLTELEVIADILEGLHSLAKKALDLGSKNNPGYFLVLTKDENYNVVADEGDVALLLEQLLLECLEALRSIDASTPVLEAERKHTKINRIMSKIMRVIAPSYSEVSQNCARLIMPRDVYNLALSYKNNSARALKKQKSMFNSSAADALFQGMEIAGGTILYPPEQIKSAIRTSYIEALITLTFSIGYFTKNILKKYAAGNINYKHFDCSNIFYVMLTLLDELGVPNTDKQIVLDRAFAKYAPLVKESGPLKELAKSSPALRKFVNKIGIPVDLSNTYDPVAEKQIAKRLRDLSRKLSTKYNVAYAPGAGDVVLAAMRKAEDLDEIMVDISDTLEDCLSYINNSGPTQE